MAFIAGGVGMLFVADEELRRPLVARVASALDGLALFQLPAVAHPAEFHLPLGNVLNIILFGDDGTSGFEYESLETFLC